MADRKQFMNTSQPDPELIRLMMKAKESVVSDEVLNEQKISFAFGNALNMESITKESVRHASQHVRLKA